MTTSAYPKITQEALKDAATVILSSLKNPAYLNGAPYSSLMCQTLREVVENFKTEITEGNIASNNTMSADQMMDADIDRQFAELAEDLENKSSEFKDNFAILKRVERTIRGLERMMISGSSDTVKMSATTKLMDFQEQQIDILERLMNIEKVGKIEGLTRRFFNEIRKIDKLQAISDRYLQMLKELN